MAYRMVTSSNKRIILSYHRMQRGLITMLSIKSKNVVCLNFLMDGTKANHQKCMSKKLDLVQKLKKIVTSHVFACFLNKNLVF